MDILKDLEEKYQDLSKKYPLFYSEGVRSGFYPSIGWINLVEEISSKIEAFNNDLVKEGKCPIICLQVKEKFGALRVYVSDNAPQEIKEMLWDYEKKSLEVCEITGEVGAFSKRSGSYKTLNSEYRDKLGYTKIDKESEQDHFKERDKSDLG